MRGVHKGLTYILTYTDKVSGQGKADSLSETVLTMLTSCEELPLIAS